MSMNNNNEPLNKTFPIGNPLQCKIICYARNCNKLAISTLILPVGSKQIPIHVCEEPLESLLVSKEVNQNT